MWLIKLPFRILAAIAAFLLTFIIVVCSILKGLSSFILGFFMLLLIIFGIYSAFGADWVGVGLCTALAFADFVAMFFMEAAVMAMEGIRDALGGFALS